jgi:hypothetical protein
MCNHALQILSDETVLLTFKEQAFEQANRFSIEAIVPKYEALYRSMLPESTPS